MHVALKLDLPVERSALGGQSVKKPIVRTNQDACAGDHRRRTNFAARLERPACLSARRIDGVENASDIAYIDDAVCNRWGRFADLARLVAPANLARQKVERHELSGGRPDEHHSICNRG